MQQQSPRPVSIDILAQFAIAFANTATHATNNADDWVARKGNMSIFSALQSIFPEVSDAKMSSILSSRRSHVIHAETAAKTK
jgi:hypothetical protein